LADAYFFLLISFINDKAAKTTNNKVKTSIVFMGITPLCTRGHQSPETHPFTIGLHHAIITWRKFEHKFVFRWNNIKKGSELNHYLLLLVAGLEPARCTKNPRRKELAEVLTWGV